MATPHKFRFYIYRVISGISYYYTVSSGVVTSTTTKDGSELEYSPINWDAIEKKWVRSESMHGIMNKLSNEYEFWGDGGLILKHLIFTYGYDVKAKLLVEIRKDSDWLYETYSDNDIKMSKPKTDIDGVSVELFDSGMASDFMANLDTPYEIPTLSDPDVITVEHEGTEVFGRYNYRYGNSTLDAKFFGEVTPGGAANGEYISHLMVTLPSEGMRPVASEKENGSLNMGEHFQNIFYIGLSGDESQQYENFIMMAYQTLRDVKIDYKASFNWRMLVTTIPNPNCYLIVDVIIAERLKPFRLRQRIYTGSTYTISSPLTVITENIDLSGISIGDLYNNERIYFCVAIMSNSAFPTLSNDFRVVADTPELSKVSITFKFENNKSEIKGFRLYKLAQKTVEAFADGKYGSTPFSSNVLSSPSSWIKGVYPYRTIITNGNAIKGVTDSIFKLSMKDIVEDVQANFGLGVGVNGNQLQIEPISTFYDDSTLIADLGELTDVTITPINDVPTLLVFGHKFNNDNDVLNGALDYNTKSTFKSQNITDLNSKKEYVSPIVASIYSIEKIRVSEYGKDTTGNKVNEDLYKLGVVETAVGGKYKINYEGSTGGGLFVAINTLDNPYNVEFSQKNMWLRLKEIINSNAYPSTTEITFQKSDRYKDMQTIYYDINTASYTSFLREDDGFSPDGTGLIWLPFDITCKVVLPKNLDALLTANPYGKFKGTYKGVGVHFYLSEATQKPSDGNSFEMKGRLTPSTNILDLVF